MKKKGTTVLALLCGVLCAACVFAYTQQIEANAEAARSEALARYGGDQIEVCVATKSIAAGEVPDATNTATRLWLVDLLPEEPVSKLADIAGRHATSAIVAGEVLSYARFEEEGTSVSVPSGLQAVAVELGKAQAVGGALRAGAIVDVYAAGSSGTNLIAPNVLVAAVADEASGRIAITLALPPQRVEEVIATTQAATLYLALPSGKEGE